MATKLCPFAALVGVIGLSNGPVPLALAMGPVDERDNLGVMAERTTDDLDSRLDALMTRIEGEYIGSWPGAFAKRPDGTTVKAWAVWKRLDLPAFSSRVLYHEVRENGPDGRILRQRIAAFGDHANRTHNYAIFWPILDSEPYARSDLHPEQLARLRPTNLPYFGRGCQVNVIGEGDGFLLSADRASCVILYPDGRSRYNQFEIRVREAGFEFFEAAYDLDGKLLAGSREPSRFRRLTADGH
jgi:hypothetical protein